jgi:hypothetical protein
MITHPIVHPKVAILAGLVAGALTLLAFAVRPMLDGHTADSSAFQSGGTSSAGVPDHPRPETLASGKVAAQNQSEAHLAQVLDAVRASLKRNDLASARVLLGALSAEQTNYRDDPRVVALQKEWQAKEAASGTADAADAPASASIALHAGHAGSRYATRHGHSGASRAHAQTSSATDNAANAHTLPVADASEPAATRAMPVQSALAVPTSAPVSSLGQSGGLPEGLQPPVMQSAQSGPGVSGAQAVSTSTPPSGIASQDPKSRAQVRMEVEQARADGALPRFGNPDPAGPGGAPSRVTHPVTLSW